MASRVTLFGDCSGGTTNDSGTRKPRDEHEPGEQGGHNPGQRDAKERNAAKIDGESGIRRRDGAWARIVIAMRRMKEADMSTRSTCPEWKVLEKGRTVTVRIHRDAPRAV